MLHDWLHQVSKLKLASPLPSEILDPPLIPIMIHLSLDYTDISGDDSYIGFG